jgi:thymidylate synthase
MSEQSQRYLEFITKVLAGAKCKPRGEEIIEIHDVPLVVDPHVPFMFFKARKYPLLYFKQEMLWKLTADPYNDSIKEHATMWASVQNPDKSFFSNYGQYWFGEQMGIWHVVMELIRDNDSRRAVIPMLSAKHLAPGVRDTVCTESVGFRIRGNELSMSIHMRSSDVIFGLGTDIPTFACLYRLVYGLLRGFGLPVCTGMMTITSMSSHIYKKHWKMAENMIFEGDGGFTHVSMPWCKAPEAAHIIASRGKFEYPSNMPLTSWLLSQDKV